MNNTRKQIITVNGKKIERVTKTTDTETTEVETAILPYKPLPKNYWLKQEIKLIKGALKKVKNGNIFKHYK